MSMKNVFVGLGLASFCANAGQLASSTFLALYAQKLGVGMGEIGFLLASYYLVSTITTIVFGRLSDIGQVRKVLIIFGLAGSAVVYWFLSISRTYFQLLFLWGFLLGITDAAHRPASAAVIAEIAPREILGRNVGVFNAFTSAGMAFGTLIGGRVADLLGLSFVFTAASFILIIGTASSLIVLKLKPRYSSRDTSRKDHVRKIAAGFNVRYLVASGMLLLCVDVFLRNCGFRGVSTFLAVYLTQLGAENTLTGAISAINFFSQIAFMPVMGWISDRVGRKRVLSVGMLATFLATFFLSIIKNPLDAIPIQIAVGFSWSSITVASNAFAAEVAPPGRLGEMMGMVLTSMNFGGVVGPIVAGIVSERFDLRMTFRILALFPLLSFLFSVRLSARSVRHSTSDTS
jgi:MFS family permease